MSLTVLISDPQFSSCPRLPALEKLLSRADVQPAPEGGLGGMLAQLFGLQATTLPIAPLTRLADGGTRDAEFWLRADPVNLVADRDRLLMMPLETLDIQKQEAQALADHINRTYQADGMKLEVLRPSRWYLHVPENPECSTHDPADIAGGPVLHFMPDGPDAARLKRLMNEFQMLLHEHPVNQAREAAGMPPVNGIWLWGGGRLPDMPRVPQGVITDMPLVRGLAMCAGSECRQWPITFDSLTASSTNLLALTGGDAQALARIETGFAQAAVELLRRGELSDITVYCGGSHVYRVTRGTLRRVWRRRRPLADLVGAI